MNKLKFFLLYIAIALAGTANAKTAINLDPDKANQMSVTFSEEGWIHTIKTNGTDPYACTTPLSIDLPYAEYKIQFQYTATKDIDGLQVFFLEKQSDGNYNTTEARSTKFGTLPATSVFQTATFIISKQMEDWNWGKAGDILRFDFGSNADNNIVIQLLGINGTDPWVESGRKDADAQEAARYLSTAYPCEISYVEVTSDQVKITGKTTKSDCHLLDGRSYARVHSGNFVSHIDGTLPSGDFTIVVDRYVYSEGYTYDRILSKWVIADANENLVSHARYADKVPELCVAAPGVFKSKKGLANITTASKEDFGEDELGIHSTTLNIVANNFIACNKNAAFAGDDDTETYDYLGTTYYIKKSKIAEYDALIQDCYNKGVVVAAVILFKSTGGTDQTGEVQYNHVMHHEECDGGNYAMPDLTDAEGSHAYAATINYLAQRYSTGEHGRIHHWIMQKEIDDQLTWTNMGDNPRLLRYIEAYEKSLRLTYNIVRQYDRNAYVLASLGSSWTGLKVDNPNYFASKSILNQLVNYSKLEGDFRWGVAYNPYPQDVYSPDFWNKDTRATYNENTKLCTLKNLEVLSDWALKRENYYKGEEKRLVILAECGTNAYLDSSENEEVQATGAAWAWKKANTNAGIDAIMWNSWADTAEGVEDGIYLGLRRNDEYTSYRGAWNIWADAGTGAEKATFAQYLEKLSVENWDAINAPVQITDAEYYRLNIDTTTASGTTATYDNSTHCYSFTTNGGDPQVLTAAITSDISVNANVLAFDYKSDKDFELQIFFANYNSSDRSYSLSEANSIRVKLPIAHEWIRTYINIAAYRDTYGWGCANDKLRIDLGGDSNIGANIGLRHMMLNSGQVEETVYLPVSLADTEIGNCTVTESRPGEYTIAATASDPNFMTQKLDTNLETTATTLIFEYKATADIDKVQFFFVDHNATEVRSLKVNLGIFS
ncbi:MAG: DUF5722 domain-containing protein [Prevotella sp.]